MNRDALPVSFSAFFAGLGYRAAITIFPVFLVITIGAKPTMYGRASEPDFLIKPYA
jgi:hypothetical protein